MPATNGFVAAVPRILPPDVADFTGRAQEASAISTLLTGRDGGGSGVVAVTGRGGVGKTALSIHVAHRLRDMFPDGQLYANLRGAGDDLPADPFAVVGRFLRYLGVDGGAVPETLEERTDLYRDLLASRRVLVILDNAASDAQVIPLIPGGPNCGVIISSRRRIGTAVGAYVLSLEVLDSENATKLLAQIAGIRRVAIEPAEVRELCAHCGFLPLAVRIAAAKLASKPHWSVSRLLEMLRVERDRLNLLVHGHLDVRANIALSYDVLPTTSQEMLRRLGDIDLPEISVWMSAAAVDMPLGAAEEVLEHLFDAQLLDIAGHDVTGHARYRMHDLVRLFAKERALAEEANSDLIAARGRAFGAWLFLADTAHRVFYGRDFQYIRGGAPRWPFDEGIARELTAEPLRWLETEREGIIAVVDRAASDRSSVCWELATATSPLFELCRLFDDWLDILRKTLAATATMGDVRGSAAIEFWMGCAFGDRTEYRSAHDHFEEAAKLFNMIGDRRGGALTTAYLGMMERLQGNRESALSLCEEALPILHDMDDLGSEAFVLRNLGQLYMEQDSALASAYLRRALAICRATGAQRAEAQVLFWNSMLNGQERRFEDAESDLQNALDICRAIGDRGGEAQCLRGLGITAQRCGDHTKAMSYLNDALALVRQPKPTFMEDQIRRSIADLQSIE